MLRVVKFVFCFFVLCLISSCTGKEAVFPDINSGSDLRSPCTSASGGPCTNRIAPVDNYLFTSKV